jgi:hypothetical protein
LDFISKSIAVNGEDLKNEFMLLKEKLLSVKNDFFEKRFLIEFDVILWIESKVRNVSMEELAKENFKTKFGAKIKI